MIEQSRLKPVKVKLIGFAGNDRLVRADLKPKAQILLTRLTLAGEGVKVKVHKSQPSKELKQPPAKVMNSAKGL